MCMGNKVIITENQLKSLQAYLKENNFYENLIQKIVLDLNQNYEPMLGIVRDNGEYFEEPMIKIKVDDSSITPKELYQYLKKKYQLGNDFIKQIIKDWMFGKIKNNGLSKNVAIS